MKLRNKRTGKIATLTLSSNGEDMIIMDNDMRIHITKLSELKDYEDYEKPKEYWYIDYDGGILCGESDNSSAEKMMISMGNQFDTLEEAEKAVEKLKAWKRLKDKGFRFTLTPGVGSLDITPGKFQIEINAEMPAKWFCCDAVQEDLDDCFGGEE